MQPKRCVMTERIISTLKPSPARRILASGASAGLGLVLLWLLVSQPGREPMLLIGLLTMSALCFGFAVVTWRATAKGLILTDDVLREDQGRVLFQLADVARIERSLLGWKPAGGFAVVTTTPKPRAWVPGLWWRAGRRVMIGGATNGGEAKAMADLMQAELIRQGRV